MIQNILASSIVAAIALADTYSVSLKDIKMDGNYIRLVKGYDKLIIR